ncbi:glycosyltransferase family 4 protein [Alteromonas sp. 14N.309.X.WAT.G.H12]|uniref:glycosyltransferase family 4 protein n=1 Tax=Alteromonas sp. 14N.309.X.WAT.G.H12 TaxID=3120824 RepID=UPI002FD5223F
MKIAMLAPIAWRTPPRHYGPWESVVSILTEGLVARGEDVTLFATGDSITSAKLKSVCAKGYEEDKTIIPKVWECLHIAQVFEQGDEFDIIHNHFDFLPLSYTQMTKTPVVTTIHGFSSKGILPVYKQYNDRSYFVSISNSDRADDLKYIDTVYHGIDLSQFEFHHKHDDYLVFFGRFHHDKGAKEAIEIAKRSGKPLIMAGIIQDEGYFNQYVKPALNSDHIQYVGVADAQQRNTLLSHAAALLHPIQFDEPFGLSVIESMACGTPVIAFNRGSMPELIIHGENGFLCNNTDDAVTAVKCIDEIVREKCQDHVKHHFSADAMVDNYLTVYQKILAQQ